MASLGHIAVGMAAARIHHEQQTPRWSSMAMWSALSMLPDADVIGFPLGVAYGDPWGHRGATHSLLFSLAVGTAIGLLAPRFRRPRVRTGLMATLVLASHALLDTLTDGGLGCALFWPFDLTRYFAPWNPIPVSPIGLDYLSGYGLMVALVELVLFSPFLAFACVAATKGAARRSRRASSCSGSWRRGSSPLTTRFASRSWASSFESRRSMPADSPRRRLRSVRRGQSEREVRQALGAPLRERWFFGFDETQPCRAVDMAQDVVVWADEPEACLELGISAGTSRVAVQDVLGSPSDGCWRYTRNAGSGYFRDRVVCFHDGKVVNVFRQWSSRPSQE